MKYLARCIDDVYVIQKDRKVHKSQKHNCNLSSFRIE